MGRTLGRLAWFVVPGLAIAAAASYLALAMAWHVNPPITAVRGTSMEPFLSTGDLVLLHGADPAKLKKGDVIAVEVPKADRSQYGLPSEIVHRIIGVERTRGGVSFQTKGDNNAGPDVFQTPSADVVGVMVGKVARLGYPILFFTSRQGEIFLGVAGVVVLSYLALGFFDRRREADPTVVLLETVVAQTSALRDELAAGASGLPGPAGDPGPSGAAPPEPAPSEPELPGPEPPGLKPPDPEPSDPVVTTASLGGGPGSEAFDRLTEALAISVETGTRTGRSVEELTAAVREYGIHLQSHTAAIQGLAGAAAHLEDAAEGLRRSLAARPAAAPTAPNAPADVAPLDALEPVPPERPVSEPSDAVVTPGLSAEALGPPATGGLRRLLGVFPAAVVETPRSATSAVRALASVGPAEAHEEPARPAATSDLVCDADAPSTDAPSTDAPSTDAPRAVAPRAVRSSTAEPNTIGLSDDGRLVHRGGERRVHAMEIDAAMVEAFGRAVLADTPNAPVFSPAIACVAWAVGRAFEPGDERPGADDGRAQWPALEVRTFGPESCASTWVLGPGRGDPGAVFEQLNAASKPPAASAEDVTVAVEDWSATGALLVARPSGPDAPDLVVTLGAVRTVVEVMVAADGSEAFGIGRRAVLAAALDPGSPMGGELLARLAVAARLLESLGR